jgi:hypothetical protein
VKVIKITPDCSSALIAADTYSQIVSGPCSITTTADSGNFINGPLSISSGIDSIKVGAIFRFNPILASGIPSTIITPIPTLVMDVPIKNLGSLAAIASLCASLV